HLVDEAVGGVDVDEVPVGIDGGRRVAVTRGGEGDVPDGGAGGAVEGAEQPVLADDVHEILHPHGRGDVVERDRRAVGRVGQRYLEELGQPGHVARVDRGLVVAEV